MGRKHLAPKFTFKGKEWEFAADSVVMYDPDTFFGVFPVEGRDFEHSFRVLGVDSIENRIPHSELAKLTEEQRKALIDRRDAALAYTSNLFRSMPFRVVMDDFDKYGRILVKVTFAGGVDLAQDLVARKLVFSYIGATKLTLE